MSDIIYVSNIGPHMSNIAMPALHSMSNTSQNHEISQYLAAAVRVLVPVPLPLKKTGTNKQTSLMHAALDELVFWNVRIVAGP